MSFSRARIQRFNDIKAATPSKDGLTVKTVSARDKCLLEKSPSTTPVQNVNTFRTPTIPKKKKTLVSGTKVAPINIFKCQDDMPGKEVCTVNNSQDDYARSLMAQIESMKKQVFGLEMEKKQLLDEKMKFEERCKHLKDEHIANFENITQEYKTNCDTLKTNINELYFEVNEIKGKYTALETITQESTLKYQTSVAEIKKLHEKDLIIYMEELQSKNTLIEEKEALLKTLLNDYNHLNDKHQEEIVSLQEKHELDMQEMQYDMIKSLAELQSSIDKINSNHARAMQELEERKKSELFEMQEKYNKEAEQLRKESAAKITQVEENCYEAKILAEIQMTETCKDIEANWKLKLEAQEKQANAILKECQAISEYNIIQCELEKNKMKQELLEKTNILEKFKNGSKEFCGLCSHMEQTFLALQLELNATISKLSEECEHLKEELEAHKRKLKISLADKKIYEISFNKTHKTIEALKNRLLHSDGDVEQLKKELEQCESQKLEIESKCNQLAAELESVNKLNEDLEIQQEKYLKENETYITDLEKDLIADVETCRLIAIRTVSELEKQLEEKHAAFKVLEEEKLSAEKKIAQLNKEIKQKTKDCNEIMDQLHEQQKITSNVQMSLGETVSAVSQLEKKYEIEIDNLQSVIVGKDEQIRKLCTNKKSCDDCNEKDDISTLLKQINQLQDKSASYYQYCEYYKNKSKEYEEEIEDLSKIRKQYIEQSGRYDTLLQKYEILEKEKAEQELLLENQKHIQCSEGSSMDSFMELSTKHDEVVKKNHLMEKKLASQTKIIEKLKKELSALSQSPKKLKSKTDKENINSPNRLLNSSLCGSPLRDRN